jgi:hypothetical protein
LEETAMARRARRTGGWWLRLALLAALLPPLASPILVAAQEAPQHRQRGGGRGRRGRGGVGADRAGGGAGGRMGRSGRRSGRRQRDADRSRLADPALAPVESVESMPVQAVVAPDSPLEAAPAMAPSQAPPPPVMAPAAAPVDWAPPTTVYVAETGQAVDGLFLDIWRAWGGALSWGNPITPELEENGRIVQYYGFGRFEWAPDDPNGEVVQFGELGKEMRPFMVRRTAAARERRRGVGGRGVPAPGSPSTGRRRRTARSSASCPRRPHPARRDARLWVQTGEAAYLGNPISEPYAANGLTYQVFERGTVVQEPGGWPYVLPVGELLRPVPATASTGRQRRRAICRRTPRRSGRRRRPSRRSKRRVGGPRSTPTASAGC